MSEAPEKKKTHPLYNVLAAAATLVATIGVGGPSLLEKIWPKNQPPAAKITATKQSGAAPLEVTFDGTKSSDPEGGELKYTWLLDNNVVSHDRSFKQQLIAPGEYVVALVVEDARKLRHQDSSMITVYPEKEKISSVQENIPETPTANAEQNQQPPAVSSLSAVHSETIEVYQLDSKSGSDKKSSPTEILPADAAGHLKEWSKKESLAPMFVNSVDPTAMLVAHNQWRSQAGSADLAWSGKLAKAAQALVDDLQNRGCTTSHSGTAYDENIFLAGAIVYSNGRKEFRKKTALEVAKKWSQDSKSYSNMIRKSAKATGCAMSACEDKSQIWACYYSPAAK